MSVDYSCHYLANGLRLFFIPSGKFKTITISLFVHQNLNQDLVALNALLPAVLEQGCSRFPDYLTLQRELENLYGAEMGTDIIKSGERHIQVFSLETAHDQYVFSSSPSNGKLLYEGMSLLGSLFSEPLVVEGSFRNDYVNQEKNQLIKDIKALLNDKTAYAQERCISLMCEDEPFGIYKLGRIDDYDSLDAHSLYRYYQELIRINPLDLYVVGDLDENMVFKTASEVFNFERNGNDIKLQDTLIGQPVKSERFIEEQMAVNQAKLVIGFRTFTGYRDDQYFPLLVYSGVLGGFPHSKLFMKVREEANLAYYIHTRLERHKGLMLISAGINSDDYKKARQIIDQQLEEMLIGKISDNELDNTKRGLINQLRSQQDSPGQLISFHLDGTVGGKIYTVEELCAAIDAVGRDEVITVAEKIKLDTVYLLRTREGGPENNG